VSEEAAIAEAAFVAVHESGPVLGFGCRPARTVRDPPAAGVRKPPRNEPAEGPRVEHGGDAGTVLCPRPIPDNADAPSWEEHQNVEGCSKPAGESQ
jgi:hypothetical protein